MPRHRVRAFCLLLAVATGLTYGFLSLAYAELNLVISALVSRFDFELFDVVKDRDIDFVGDCFLGLVRSDSHGVQVLVRDVEK